MSKTLNPIPNFLPHLTALLAQLDALANDAWRAGDEKHERYYTNSQNHLRILTDNKTAKSKQDFAAIHSHQSIQSLPTQRSNDKLRVLNQMARVFHHDVFARLGLNIPDKRIKRVNGIINLSLVKCSLSVIELSEQTLSDGLLVNVPFLHRMSHAFPKCRNRCDIMDTGVALLSQRGSSHCYTQHHDQHNQQSLHFSFSVQNFRP